MAAYHVTGSQLTAIADALRQKGGTNQPLLFPGGFVSAIGALPVGGTGGADTSDATATAADILLGKTAYVNGEKLTGTFDGYRLCTGNLSVSSPASEVSIENLPFSPVGIALYHTRPGNATYYVTGENTLLSCVGTIENSGTRTVSWNSTPNGVNRIGSADVYLLDDGNALLLIADGVFHGPYGYTIWGK